MAAKLASGERDTAEVHVPENSPARPETVALQAPFHACGDLLADHPPRIRILPAASWITHVPVTTVPFCCASAVQIPAKDPAFVEALQVPCNSAPETSMAEPAKVARRAAVNTFSM